MQTIQTITGYEYADTVIAQLGGAKIFAMAFTLRGTLYSNEAITLRIAPALSRGVQGKATHVHIVLGANDTYEVSLRKYGRLDFVGTTVAKYEGVYADNLRDIVETLTGLRLSLGTMSAR